MSTSCTADDAPGLRRTAGLGRAHAAQQALEQLPAGLAGRVAHELAPHRRARDRVAAVQRDVGLVGAELFAVVRHVPAPVEVDRRERREAEQPASDPVVPLAVAEQQPVRGLVHQRRELRVGAAHEQEHDDPHDEVVAHTASHDDPDRLHAHRHDRQRVAEVRDAAQLLAERGRGPGVGLEPVGGAELLEQAGSGTIVAVTPAYYTLPTDGDRT